MPHYIPSIMLYSHTVTDLATHRTITNYDPRRRLRTPTSTMSGATKQTVSNYNTHNNHNNNNGFVVADSSSTYNNHWPITSKFSLNQTPTIKNEHYNIIWKTIWERKKTNAKCCWEKQRVQTKYENIPIKRKDKEHLFYLRSIII